MESFVQATAQRREQDEVVLIEPGYIRSAFDQNRS
jgi:hypothetical protein